MGRTNPRPDLVGIFDMKLMDKGEPDLVGIKILLKIAENENSILMLKFWR